MVQPASVDVRLDRYFRLFDNHKYPVIDPAADQPDLTRLVEVADDEPFVLHPGEFVLASTYEVITLCDDIAAGWKASPRWTPRPADPLHGRLRRPRLHGHVTLELSNVATLPITLWPGMKVGPVLLLSALLTGRAPVRHGTLRQPLSGTARAHRVPVVRELPPNEARLNRADRIGA